jgi:hypothetical protein
MGDVNLLILDISGMKGIQGDWRFSAKVGCQNIEFQSRGLCFSVMDMAVLALSSLKVCLCNCTVLLIFK